MHRIHSIDRIDGFRQLSARETQLIVLASEGLTDKEIARFLGISCGTVVTMWSRMRAKLGISSRVSAVAVVVSCLSRLVERFGRHDENLESTYMLVSMKGVTLALDTAVIANIGVRPGESLSRLSADDFTQLDGRPVLETALPWASTIATGKEEKGHFIVNGKDRPERAFSFHSRVVEDPILGQAVLVEFVPILATSQHTIPALIQAS